MIDGDVLTAGAGAVVDFGRVGDTDGLCFTDRLGLGRLEDFGLVGCVTRVSGREGYGGALGVLAGEDGVFETLIAAGQIGD